MQSTSHQTRSSAHAPRSPSRWTCPSSPPLTTGSTSRPLPRFTFRNGSSHPTISSYSPIYGKTSKEQPHTTLLHLLLPSPFPLTTHLSHAHSHTFPPSLLSPPLLQKAPPPAGRSSTYAAPTLRHTRIFTAILAGYAQVQPSNPVLSSAAHRHRSSTKASRQAA